jgi:hypothetical protein
VYSLLWFGYSLSAKAYAGSLVPSVVVLRCGTFKRWGLVQCHEDAAFRQVSAVSDSRL